MASFEIGGSEMLQVVQNVSRQAGSPQILTLKLRKGSRVRVSGDGELTEAEAKLNVQADGDATIGVHGEQLMRILSGRHALSFTVDGNELKYKTVKGGRLNGKLVLAPPKEIEMNVNDLKGEQLPDGAATVFRTIDKVGMTDLLNPKKELPVLLRFSSDEIVAICSDTRRFAIYRGPGVKIKNPVDIALPATRIAGISGLLEAAAGKDTLEFAIEKGTVYLWNANMALNVPQIASEKSIDKYLKDLDKLNSWDGKSTLIAADFDKALTLCTAIMDQDQAVILRGAGSKSDAIIVEIKSSKGHAQEEIKAPEAGKMPEAKFNIAGLRDGMARMPTGDTIDLAWTAMEKDGRTIVDLMRFRSQTKDTMLAYYQVGLV